MELGNVKGLNFKNSTIKECSEGIITAESCSGLLFTGSYFVDNMGYDLLYFVDCGDVYIYGSSISDNKAYSGEYAYNGETSLFFVEGNTNVKVEECEMFSNDLPSLQSGEGNFETLYTEISDNTWDRYYEDQYYEEDYYEEDYYEEEGGY